VKNIRLALERSWMFHFRPLSILFYVKNTYLLYLWDVLDEHDLVKSTMQQLLDGIDSASGSTGVLSVITKHKTDDNDSLSS